FRGKNSQGKTGVISDFDLLNLQGRVASIGFDSDRATSSRVSEACRVLARELYRRGARVAYAIDIPEVNDEKAGLDDFLTAYGVDAFLELDVEELPSPYPRIRTWSGVELRETVMERPPAIVPAWGVRQAGKVILCGKGGSAKSTVILQWVCHSAAGTPLFGYPALEVAGPQRVAVLMAEDPLSEVKFRWEQQMRALGYGNDVAERIAFLDPQGSVLKLTNEDSRAALFDKLRQHGATEVILDPLVAFHDVEENSNSAMRGVLDLLTPFQEETGCAFIIVHHEPKSPENNGAASRGASAIRDWCRTMLRLTAHEEDENGTQRFTLALDKANYGGTVWNLSLERAQDSYLFTPVTEVAVTPVNVWELIGPEGRWAEDLKLALIEQFGISEPTARRAIGKAQEANLITIESRLNPETKRKKAYVLGGGTK
ncbi:MAG: AAA family ATPase, partial [Candidatus Binatia bacterium]